MNLTKEFTLLLAGCCIFTVNTNAQTSGKLLLVKGQKIQIDNNIKSVINQEMMGQAIEIIIDANMIHQLEVKDKKTGSYMLSSTLTKLTTNGNAMGQEIKFDSDKKADIESETGKALKDQLNVNKEVEIDENAHVINGIKKDVKAAGGVQLMDMVNNITGGNADESNGASAAFEILPAGKKIGDSWTDSTITDELKTYRSYTLKQLTGNDATITLNGKQITKKKIEQQGMEINVNMEGKLSGEELVDISSGLVKNRTLVMDGTGTAEVMGQSIPVKTKITTTTNVKKI